MFRSRVSQRFLCVAVLGFVLPGSAGAATYSATGFVSVGFSGPGSPGPIVNKPYSMSGEPGTGGGELLNDQGQTFEHTSLHGQANSLGDRGLLRSHAYAQ